MQDIEFELITNDGLKLYARIWPQNKKPKAVICLVHGIGEHSGRYAHMADFLNQKGYDMMSFDLRGHGRSQGKRGDAPGYDFLMDDISLFLTEAVKRYPNNKIFLFGHSLGGNLVLNYALRRKPDILGIIASGPALKTADDPSALRILITKVLYYVYPGLSISTKINPKRISRDPEVVKAYVNDPLVHDRITPRFALDFLNAGLWALENAGNFPLPLLIMHGEMDSITSVDASKEFAERAGECCHLKIWEGCYHEVHNEPEKMEFFEYMVNWVNKI